MKPTTTIPNAPIHLFSQWKKICLNPKCSVLKEFNNQVIALHKPSGILSHPNTNAQALNALIKGPYNQNKEFYSTIDTTFPKVAPHLFKTTLIHRLDQQTSGVILVTYDNEKVANIIKEAFRGRKVEKEYFALVSGINVLQGKASDTWIDNYDRSKIVGSHNTNVRNDRSARNKRSTAFTKEFAETVVTIVDENKKANLSLLKLNPATGFTHQLRYQCSLHGYPILGDGLYGDFSLNKDRGFKRLFLHSHSIQLEYDYENTKERIEAKSDVPSEFEKILKADVVPRMSAVTTDESVAADVVLSEQISKKLDIVDMKANSQPVKLISQKAVEDKARGEIQSQIKQYEIEDGLDEDFDSDNENQIENRFSGKNASATYRDRNDHFQKNDKARDSFRRSDDRRFDGHSRSRDRDGGRDRYRGGDRNRDRDRNNDRDRGRDRYRENRDSDYEFSGGRDDRNRDFSRNERTSNRSSDRRLDGEERKSIEKGDRSSIPEPIFVKKGTSKATLDEIIASAKARLQQKKAN